MRTKPQTFKVYVVADAYKWHDLSVYPDVYQNWVRYLTDSPNELTLFFQTVQMTKEEYEQTCKDLQKWRFQEARGDAPPSQHETPKRNLNLVTENTENGIILEFPRKKDE